jgi:regulator of replication initiation timing
MDAKSRKKYLERMQSTVFSFTRFNFSKLWKAALEKTNLYEVDIDTGRVTLRPHNLRKYFRTHGRWSNPDVPEALMGHQSGVVNIYARFDSAEEILKEGYHEAEPNLSIYESTTNVIALRNQVDQQSEDIQRLITNLSLENARLKLDLEGLKQSFREFKTIEMRMNTLEANQNDIITNPEYVNIMKFFSENHKEIERFLKNRDK